MNAKDYLRDKDFVFKVNTDTLRFIEYDEDNDDDVVDALVYSAPIFYPLIKNKKL